VVFINVIKIVLKIKSPASEAENLDFAEKTEEILESVKVFNDKFRDWSKRIIITHLTKRAMYLLIVIERANVAENLSVKEIRSFIQYLRNNKGWSIYSREKNKMFETVEFYKLDIDKVISTLDKVKLNNTLYQSQKEDIDFMEETDTIKALEHNTNADMDDEDMITVLNYLIRTRNKGIKAGEKAEDIEHIKIILHKWL